MIIDIEKPRWRSGKAAEIAGLDVNLIGMMRKRSGFAIGTWRNSEFRFSALDVAETTLFVALRALAFPIPDALQTAHDQRGSLKSLLINRLVHGFWSKGGLVFPVGDFGSQTLYFDAIGERVITKLALPLPVRPLPRSTETALRMVDAIFDYIESPSGALRWRRWRAAVVSRGGKTSFDEAAAELGAPHWFLTAMYQVVTGQADRPGDPLIVEAVLPRAKGASEHITGVVLQ